jgi:hypothetical protein
MRTPSQKGFGLPLQESLKLFRSGVKVRGSALSAPNIPNDVYRGDGSPDATCYLSAVIKVTWRLIGNHMADERRSPPNVSIASENARDACAIHRASARFNPVAIGNNY